MNNIEWHRLSKWAERSVLMQEYIADRGRSDKTDEEEDREIDDARRYREHESDNERPY
jgi:hypothetical protein